MFRGLVGSASVLVGLWGFSGRSLDGLLAVRKNFHPAWGVEWSLCGRVFWAVLVQECLEGRFLPLQAGCRVGGGSGSSCSLFQVPWSELKKF